MVLLQKHTHTITTKKNYKKDTHQVYLNSGDMLLYESSKCFHGRPIPLHGSWYTSIFVHYYPKYEEWTTRDHFQEMFFSVPPKWNEEFLLEHRDGQRQRHSQQQSQSQQSQSSSLSKLPALELTDFTFTEPSCPNKWCNSQHAIPFPSSHGQEDDTMVVLEEGVWMGPNGQRYPLSWRRPASPPTLNEEL